MILFSFVLFFVFVFVFLVSFTNAWYISSLYPINSALCPIQTSDPGASFPVINGFHNAILEMLKSNKNYQDRTLTIFIIPCIFFMLLYNLKMMSYYRNAYQHLGEFAKGISHWFQQVFGCSVVIEMHLLLHSIYKKAQ